jgi:hypothetical protein
MTRKVIYDIRLSFEHPPIPDRNFDWSATRSNYDQGDPIGRGRTPAIALADLLDQEMEAADEGLALHVEEGGTYRPRGDKGQP